MADRFGFERVYIGMFIRFEGNVQVSMLSPKSQLVEDDVRRARPCFAQFPKVLQRLKTIDPGLGENAL